MAKPISRDRPAVRREHFDLQPAPGAAVHVEFKARAVEGQDRRGEFAPPVARVGRDKPVAPKSCPKDACLRALLELLGMGAPCASVTDPYLVANGDWPGAFIVNFRGRSTLWSGLLDRLRQTMAGQSAALQYPDEILAKNLSLL